MLTFHNGGRQAALFIAALALICASYLAINHRLVTELLYVISEDSMHRVRFLAILLLVSGCLFVWMALTLRASVWTLLLLLFFASTLTGFAYFAIMGIPLEADVAEWLWSERSQLGNAIEEFFGQFLQSTAITATLFTLVVFAAVLARANRPQLEHAFLLKFGKWAESASLLLFVSWNSVLFNVDLPSSPVETGSFLAFVAAWTAGEPDSEPVTFKPSPSPITRIIVVVDESVRADYYDELLKPEVIAAGGIDFGRAMSIAPCSAASNALIRWGIDPRDTASLSRDPRRNPQLWGYGKAAGYRTFLFDGQSRGTPSNFLGAKERAKLTLLAPLEDGIDTDRKLASLVNLKVRGPERSLSYIVKRGTHFPYNKNYPAGTLPKDSSLEETYKEAIVYPNRMFLARLTEDLDMSQTLIIYTSDHGQRLRRPGLPHCNQQPDFEEYAVPLALITGNTSWRSALLQAAAQGRNKASHYQIFSTILLAMGYDKDEVEKRYFPSLLSENVGYYGVDPPYFPYPSARFPTIRIRQFPGFPFSRAAESVTGES